MLHCTTRPLRFIPIIALAAGMLASTLLNTVCHADTIGNEKVGAIRLGVDYLASSSTRHTFTSSVASAGLDYNLGEIIGQSRSVLSIDYIQRSSGGSGIQIIPITISEQYYHTIGGTGFTPYGEAGIGGYFVRVNDLNNSSLIQTHSETALGGFVGGGIDLNSEIFLDLRYHLVGSIKGEDPSGYELTAGLRF